MRSWIIWKNSWSCIFCVLALSGLGIISALPNEADAAIYYVSTANGAKDSNPGTLVAPFLTLGKGVSILSPGDTLMVRGGSYVGGPHFQDNISSGNSWSDPVTIKAYQSEIVTITAPPGQSALFFKKGNHHIIVDGFVFDGTGGAGGMSTGYDTHHIRIMNSEIKNAPKSGVLTSTGSCCFEFINLDIHHNGTDGVHDHGMYITTNNHIVKNSRIHHNCCIGITIHSASGQKPSDNLLIGNEIYENSRCGEEGAATGINIAMGGERNRIVNNLVWGNIYGIRVRNVNDTKILNNTVVYNKKSGIMLDSKDNPQNSYLANNIVSMNGTNVSGHFQIWIMSGHPATLDNNLLFHTDSAKLFQNANPHAVLSGNLIGIKYDPKFSNHKNYDLRLQEGSFAIDSGKIINEVKGDIEGTLRSQKNEYDIGAYLFNAKSQLGPNNLKIVGIRQ